jgi:hypothetical protein
MLSVENLYQKVRRQKQAEQLKNHEIAINPSNISIEIQKNSIHLTNTETQTESMNSLEIENFLKNLPDNKDDSKLTLNRLQELIGSESLKALKKLLSMETKQKKKIKTTTKTARHKSREVETLLQSLNSSFMKDDIKKIQEEEQKLKRKSLMAVEVNQEYDRLHDDVCSSSDEENLPLKEILKNSTPRGAPPEAIDYGIDLIKLVKVHLSDFRCTKKLKVLKYFDQIDVNELDMEVSSQTSQQSEQTEQSKEDIKSLFARPIFSPTFDMSKTIEINDDEENKLLEVKKELITSDPDPTESLFDQPEDMEVDPITNSKNSLETPPQSNKDSPKDIQDPPNNELLNLRVRDVSELQQQDQTIEQSIDEEMPLIELTPTPIILQDIQDITLKPPQVQSQSVRNETKARILELQRNSSELQSVPINLSTATELHQTSFNPIPVELQLEWSQIQTKPQQPQPLFQLASMIPSVSLQDNQQHRNVRFNQLTAHSPRMPSSLSINQQPEMTTIIENRFRQFVRYGQPNQSALSISTHSNTLVKHQSSIPSTSISNSKIIQECLKSLFKCMEKHCSYYTNSALEFHHHLLNHDLINGLICAYCKLRQNNIESLINHIMNAHKYQRYACTKCFYRAITLDHIKVHFEFYHHDPNAPNPQEFFEILNIPHINVVKLFQFMKNNSFKVVKQLDCPGK